MVKVYFKRSVYKELFSSHLVTLQLLTVKTLGLFMLHCTWQWPLEQVKSHSTGCWLLNSPLIRCRITSWYQEVALIGLFLMEEICVYKDVAVNYIVVVLIKHKTHGLSNLVRNSHFRTREPAFVYPTCSSNFSCLYFYIWVFKTVNCENNNNNIYSHI